MLVSYLKAVSNRLREVLPKFISIYEHMGDIRESDLEKLPLKLPAIVIGCRGIREAHQVGATIHGDVEMMLAILAQPGRHEAANEPALAIVDELFRLVPYETWSERITARVPEELRVFNEYLPSLYEKKISLYSFQFIQTIEIPRMTQCALDRLDLFLRMNHATDYNLTSGSFDPDGQADFEYLTDLSGTFS